MGFRFGDALDQSTQGHIVFFVYFRLGDGDRYSRVGLKSQGFLDCVPDVKDLFPVLDSASIGLVDENLGTWVCGPHGAL